MMAEISDLNILVTAVPFVRQNQGLGATCNLRVKCYLMKLDFNAFSCFMLFNLFFVHLIIKRNQKMLFPGFFSYSKKDIIIASL